MYNEIQARQKEMLCLWKSELNISALINAFFKRAILKTATLYSALLISPFPLVWCAREPKHVSWSIRWTKEEKTKEKSRQKTSPTTKLLIFPLLSISNFINWIITRNHETKSILLSQRYFMNTFIQRKICTWRLLSKW